MTEGEGLRPKNNRSSVFMCVFVFVCVSLSLSLSLCTCECVLCVYAPRALVTRTHETHIEAHTALTHTNTHMCLSISIEYVLVLYSRM